MTLEGVAVCVTGPPPPDADKSEAFLLDWADDLRLELLSEMTRVAEVCVTLGASVVAAKPKAEVRVKWLP